MRRCGGLVLAMVILVVLSHGAGRAEIPVATIKHDGPVDFQKHVLPILRAKCFACHNASAKEGDLILETPESIRKGGGSGPAVVPGKSEESLLLQLAAHRMEPHMPPPDNKVGATPMTSEELGWLKLWIDQGATGTVSLVVLPEKWRPLPKNYAPIQAVAVSPDNQFVACSRGNRVLIYHLASGATVAELSDMELSQFADPGCTAPAHTDLVQALAFDRVGERLASAAFRQVKLWKRPQDVRLWQVSLPARCTALAVQPQDRWLAVGDEQGTIQVWQAGQDQPFVKLSAHTAIVNQLRFVRTMPWLISGSEDGSVCVWKMPSGDLVRKIETPQPVRCLAVLGPLPRQEGQPYLSGDTSFWLLTAGGDNLIRCWALSVSEPRRVSLSVSPIASGIASDPQGTYVGVVGQDRHIRLMDARSCQVVHQQPLDEVPVHVAIGPATEQALPSIFVGFADGTWRWLGAAPGRENLTGFVGQSVNCWALATDGSRIAAGGSDGWCAVYRVSAEVPPVATGVDLNTIHMACFTADGQWSLLAGQQQDRSAIVLVDLSGGKVVARRSFDQQPRAIALSANRQLAAVAFGTSVQVLDATQEGLPDAAIRQDLPREIMHLALSPDGQSVLAADQEFSVRQWQVANAAQSWEWKDGQPVDGVLYIGNQPAILSQRSIRWLNPGDGTIQRSLDMPAVIEALGISADAARMAVACQDGKLRVVEVASGQERLQISLPWPKPSVIRFHADGSLLWAARQEQGAAFWQLVWNENRAVVVERWNDSELAAGTLNASGSYWDCWKRDGRWVRQLVRFERLMSGLNQAVVRLVLHPNEQVLYTVSADGTIRGHRIADGQPFFAVGHGSSVRALALSRDGQWLATGGDNGQVRVWNAGNGSPANPQPEGAFVGPVVSVGFTPDGTRLAAFGSQPSELRVWEIASGALLERRRHEGGEPAGLALVGTGVAELASAVNSGELLIGPLHAVKRIAGHGQEVTALCASLQTAAEFYSGSRDSTVRRWNVLTGQTLQQFNHGAVVLDVDVSPDGARVASAGENGSTRLWNGQNGQMVAELRGDLRLKNDVGQWTRRVAQANTRLTRSKQALEAAEKELPAVQEAAKKASDALAEANKQLEEKTSQLRSVTDMKLQREKVAIETASAAQQALAAKRQAEKLAADATHQAQRLRERANRLAALAQSMPQNAQWARMAEEARQQAQQAEQQAQQATAAVPAAQQAFEAATRAANEAAGKVAEIQKPYSDAVQAMQNAQKTQVLAAQNQAIAERERQQAEARIAQLRQAISDADNEVQKAQAGLQQAQQQAASAEQPIYRVVFSPDGSLLATAGRHPSIQIWDAQNGSSLSALAAHQQPVTGIAFADAQQLFSGGHDGLVALWDTRPAWQLERTLTEADLGALFTHRVTALDFSPDGKMLAIAGGMPSRDGAIGIWSIPEARWVQTWPNAHNDTVYAVAFSPDGRRLASGGADKLAKIFDVASGQLLRRLEGHTNYVLGIAWHSNGTTVATSGADRTVKIWNAESGDQLRTIENFGKHVTTVRFMGDSDNIVSACGDGVIRMHNSSNGGNFRNFGGAGYVSALAISQDQQWLVAGAMDGQLRLWNANNGQLLRTWAP